MLFLRRFFVVVVVVLVHALVLYKLRPHFRPPPDDEPRYAVQLISVEAATGSAAEPSAAMPASSASPAEEPASEPNEPNMAPPLVKDPKPAPQPDTRDEPPVEPPTPSPEVAKPSPATETAIGSSNASPNDSSNVSEQGSVAPDTTAQALAGTASDANSPLRTTGTSAGKPDDEELYRVAPSWTAVGLHNPRPTYPPTSLRLGEAGEVVVSVFVSEAGKAIDAVVKTSSGFNRLDENAVESVLTWRFRPGTYRGVPQAQWVNVPVQYDPRQYAASPR